MADDEKSLSLIESLKAYQETQETLNNVVSSASKALGPDWMSLLPDALDRAPMDEQERSLLKDKANHAIHYYGALAAWEEAYQYINAPHSVDRMMILERIPTLEYWLALFGDEGVNVLNQVKSLVQVQDAPEKASDETTPVEPTDDLETKADFPAESENVVPENVPTEEVTAEEENSVVEQVPSLEEEPIVDIYAQRNNIQGPAPIPAADMNDDGKMDEQDIDEDRLKQMEKEVFEPAPETVPPESESPVEAESDEQAVIDDLKEDAPAVEPLPDIEEEKVEEPAGEVIEEPVEPAPVEQMPIDEAPDEPAPVEQLPVEEPIVDEVPVEETPADEVAVADTVVEEMPVEEMPVEEMPVEEVAAPVADEVPIEETPAPVEDETPVESASIDETPADEFVAPVAVEETSDVADAADVQEAAVASETTEESIPSQSQDANFDENILAILSQEQPKDLNDDPNTHIPLTRSWEMTNLLNKKSLYENGVNWISAFCVRHDNANKEEYPYYGMIVDVMVDLKETIQSVLDNQLLDEVIDQEYEGGREALERFKESIEAELAGLPDNLKPENRAENKLNAKEIIGDLDTSNDKVVVEAAPDGFELMDDPFETSAEQIISDFEKAEAASEGDLNNLDVLPRNQKTGKKKGKEDEKK